MQVTNETQIKKPKKIKSAKVQRAIFIIVMLAFPVAQFLVFWLGVNIDSILLTFKKFDWNTGKYIYAGLINYKNVFDNLLHDFQTRRLVKNSLLYMPVTCFISLPLSLIFSYFLYKRVPGNKFFRVVFFLPSILPVVVLTMTFAFLFDSNLGPINTILKTVFHMESADIPSWFGAYPTAQIMVFAYCIWAGLGYNILLMGGAIARIPSEIMEYGKLEGITWWKEFIHVVIPMIWPTITTTFILGCTSVFTVMLQPMLLTSNSPLVQTISLAIYNSVKNNGNQAYYATFGLVCSLIGLPFILLIRFILTRFNKDVDY